MNANLMNSYGVKDMLTSLYHFFVENIYGGGRDVLFISPALRKNGLYFPQGRYHSCRESFIASYAGSRAVKFWDNNEAGRPYLIVAVRSRNALLYAKTAMQVLSIFEKRTKLSATKIDECKIPEEMPAYLRNNINLFLVEYDKEWLAAPFLISFFLLVLRSSASTTLKRKPQAKTLKALYGRIKKFRHKGGDMGYLEKSLPYIISLIKTVKTRRSFSVSCQYHWRTNGDTDGISSAVDQIERMIPKNHYNPIYSATIRKFLKNNEKSIKKEVF